MHIQGKSVNYMQPINIVDFYITWSKKALDSTTKSSCKTGQLNWRKTELCDPEALTLSLFVNIRSRTCPHTGLRIPSRGEHFKTMNIYWFMFFWHAVVSLRRNGTPPLFDVLPFEINNENYFLLICIICTKFDNFPRSSVGWSVG